MLHSAACAAALAASALHCSCSSVLVSPATRHMQRSAPHATRQGSLQRSASCLRLCSAHAHHRGDRAGEIHASVAQRSSALAIRCPCRCAHVQQGMMRSLSLICSGVICAPRAWGVPGELLRSLCSTGSDWERLGPPAVASTCPGRGGMPGGHLLIALTQPTAATWIGAGLLLPPTSPAFCGVLGEFLGLCIDGQRLCQIVLIEHPVHQSYVHTSMNICLCSSV